MTDRPARDELDATPWCCNGNAEDCVLCTDPNPPYPFLCPGHPLSASNQRLVGEAVQEATLDTCRPVEVDGETVRVRGAGELTEEGQEAVAALVRVAKARFVAEAPEQVGVLQTRLRAAHKARRAKEHQLDDIRRALCDAGFMEDDDPYSHADLADVIRQAGEAVQAEKGRLGERLRLLTDEKVADVTGPTTNLLCEEINRLKAEKEGQRAATADALAAELHRRVQRLDELKQDSKSSERVREQVHGEVIGLRGAIGIVLGACVPGGTADVDGADYYVAWRARQEVQA